MLVWRGPHLLWLCLQTFGLVLQARPFPFHTTDCFQYSYPICDWCCHRNRKGPACETNLSKSKKVTSWQDIGLENNVWNGPEDTKATKHSKKNVTVSLQRRQNQNSLPSVPVQTVWRLLPWLQAHLRGTSPSDYRHRYKPLRILQFCINEKTILPVGITRDWTEQLDHRWKLACMIAWETMILIIKTIVWNFW